MRLKKIRLAGFKSFVDPTNIPFPDDMTAIVGPNGCGKSNVIDAVRWVLGESSAKNLRGDAMTDVIFNGSSVRKPVSQCSVELVFDNSSGRIQGEFAGYNELSVKRVVTREAQSFYYLNNAKCRRRDVTDLFLGTGLGPRSYAIIEQGMISRLIESKPQELRVFIEEAAGISKYKERRRETENRIKHTRENLERLEDVRMELGQQLDKLQRQAAAARRYKELKAIERKFKGELAAIRWLKHTASITELETQIERQENEIQQFIVEQRGDESSITRYHDALSTLKQQLADVQQKNFTLATEITRIEQNQIHSKQRTNQIQQEVRSLNEAIIENEEQIGTLQARVEELQSILDESEPQRELIIEQLLQAEETLAVKEEEFQEKQSLWRQQELQFNNIKQQIQSTYSQIQSGLQMQLRTEQRISELQEEADGLKDSSAAAELQDTLEELTLIQEEYEQAKEEAKNAEQYFVAAKQEFQEAQLAQTECFRELQQLKATLQGLENLHAKESEHSGAVANWLANNDCETQSIWEYLNVEPGWEVAFETALQQWHSALVVNERPAYINVNGLRLFFSDSLTEHKPENSLATKCRAERVPQWLTRVIIAEDEQVAMRLQAQLSNGESSITQDGLWIGADWSISGVDAEHSGALERLAEMNHIEEQIEQCETKYSELLDREQVAQQKVDKLQVDREKSQEKRQSFEVSLQQLQKQQQFLQQQVERQQQHKNKLLSDLASYKEQLLEEQEQQEELNEQVAMLEEQLGELDGDYDGIEQLRQQMQLSIEQSRVQVAQYQNESHRLELNVQSHQNQLLSAQDNEQRTQAQINNMQEKLRQLEDELHEMTMPMEEQAERLEILLNERSEAQQLQEKVSDELAEVEGLLSDIEKGRQGIQSRIEKAREIQQSTKLECEGFRVRANAVVEQLQEMNQPLKPLLEQLPEDADEKLWQDTLEKTTASLSRLGAVNLAAVEEYEIQAERKQHLDTQNDDLVAALETLENAIRKIDRETRARFRDTFDQVNNDLKQLFPKVFGGGAAYLELTDDDLLDTGVTIMARPPGKKNSTIHLLSGGEKALTALSLVFAIFRLNPAPFCLLDEVDAPLDDANVGRFCKLVSEMSKSVQFIYITHNKIAMEMAMHLTGVTMAEPGVSRVVAVDVEEAVAIVNA